ncbi:N-acetyltransferase [Mycoplasmatota bacterium]|nr:N-acetyltransferase [Mycoplasmatota bacterium]
MITIRQEQVKDYKDIAEVNAQAFTDQNFIGEVALVDALRRGSFFDPELSLVALCEDKVVGHALFYPQKSFINEIEIPSVLLGPISVLPEYQKKGIGKLLIEEGHRIAFEKGYKYSFLWGHDTYYPRFGYVTNMFGESIIKINLETIEEDTNLQFRQVETKDTPVLVKMWEKWFKTVDLAVQPSELLLDWISNYTNVRSRIIEKDNEIIGYIRYEKDHLENVKMFLSKDKESTDLILRYFKKELNASNVILPIYETEFAKEMFKEYDASFVNTTWGACMICILDKENDLVNTYVQEVISGIRKPGQVILSTNYEME